MTTLQPFEEPLLPPDFVRLTTITIECIVRLENWLNRQKLVSTKPEYHAIMAKMLDVCHTYRHEFFRNIVVIKKIFGGDTLVRLDEVKIRNLLQNASAAFLVTHELALFLPRESVRREMLSF